MNENMLDRKLGIEVDTHIWTNASIDIEYTIPKRRAGRRLLCTKSMLELDVTGPYFQPVFSP